MAIRAPCVPLMTPGIADAFVLEACAPFRRATPGAATLQEPLSPCLGHHAHAPALSYPFASSHAPRAASGARALALDPLDLCLQLALTHPDLTRSRWARRRRRHWRPSPCPEVASSGNAAAVLFSKGILLLEIALIDLKGYSRLR